jgi:hypothetical protein
MTPEENQRVDELVKQISNEKDPARFIILVRELNEVLEKPIRLEGQKRAST